MGKENVEGDRVRDRIKRLVGGGLEVMLVRV